MTSTRTIADLQIENERLSADLAATKRAICVAIGEGIAASVAYTEAWQRAVVEAEAEAVGIVSACAPPRIAAWNDPRWEGWTPDKAYEDPGLRVGAVGTIPHYVPAVGSPRSVLIRTNAATAASGLALLRSLILRWALVMPGQARFTLFDPATLGQAFLFSGPLRDQRTVSGDTYPVVEALLDEISLRKREYLDAECPSLDRVPKERRADRPYEVVCAAHFPDGYEARTIAGLGRIAAAGWDAGVHLFIHYNAGSPHPRDFDMSALVKDSYVIDVAADGRVRMGDYTVVPDLMPPPDLMRSMLTAAAAWEAEVPAVSWSEVVGLARGGWWSETSRDVLQTPLGRRSNGAVFGIWLGEAKEAPCVHGVLAGSPGMGKSNLLKTFIDGLAIRYSPDQLRLYLVDGKYGQEFHDYRTLPHVEVLSLRTPPEMARSILRELVHEMQRRADVFTAAGSNGLRDYLAKGGDPLPRLLLIVDEYQIFFEDDGTGEASSQLRVLAEKGRAAGIHVLLASQSFRVADMQDRRDILAQFQLRAALPIAPEAAAEAVEFEREGRRLIGEVALKGRLVLNQSSGTDGKNVIGRVALVDAEAHLELIAELGRAARQTSLALVPPGRIVFSGDAQPALGDNAEYRGLLAADTWPTDGRWEELARRPLRASGLGLEQWYAGEHPYVSWLGRELDVYGHARCVLRRRGFENLVMVGADRAVRLGMLCAFLAGLCLVHEPRRTEFMLINGSLVHDRGADEAYQACIHAMSAGGFACLHAGTPASEDSLATLVDRLVLMLTARKAMARTAVQGEPSVFVFVVDPEQDETFIACRGHDDLVKTPAGAGLLYLANEGSRYGVHVVAAFEKTAGLQRMYGRSGAGLFQHRAGLAMTDTESQVLMETHRLNSLQRSGSAPVYAALRDVNGGLRRFLPYTLDPARTDGGRRLVEDLENLARRLAERRTS